MPPVRALANAPCDGRLEWPDSRKRLLTKLNGSVGRIQREQENDASDGDVRAAVSSWAWAEYQGPRSRIADWLA